MRTLIKKFRDKFNRTFDAKFIETDFSSFKISDFVKAIILWFVITMTIQAVGLVIAISQHSKVNMGFLGSISIILSEIFVLLIIARKRSKQTEKKTMDIVLDSISGFGQLGTNFKMIVLVSIFIASAVMMNMLSGVVITFIQISTNTMVLDQNAQEVAKMIDQSKVSLIAVSILAPIFEETVFRGILQTSLNKWLDKTLKIDVKWTYLITTWFVAFLFAFFHNGSFNPYLIIRYLLIGLYFQHVAHKYHSIYASIYTHMGMNTVAAVMMLFL